MNGGFDIWLNNGHNISGHFWQDMNNIELFNEIFRYVYKECKKDNQSMFKIIKQIKNNLYMNGFDVKKCDIIKIIKNNKNMIRQSEEYWIPVKENDKGEYIECDSEKMKQMIEDSKLLISNHDDKVVMRFKIPVGIKSNKKWYQFWKKNIDTQIHKDTISEMMALYKKDFEWGETTGEVKINDNKELKINKDFLL